MRADEMHAAITRAGEALSDRARLEEYLDFYSDDIVFHGHGPRPVASKEAVRALYAEVLAAFPDLRVTVLDSIAEEAGSRLAVRYRVWATHAGQFRGVAATQRPVEYEGVMFLRFDEYACVERWTLNDRLTLMTQIGAVSTA